MKNSVVKPRIEQHAFSIMLDDGRCSSDIGEFHFT
jgi:hypothetical protein